MANDFSWVPDAIKNTGNMLGLDPRAKAEGRVLQSRADLQDMEAKHKPILYAAQAGNQNAQAGYHTARTGAIQAEETAKADFAQRLRTGMRLDESTGQIVVDPSAIADLLASHPYAPKAMAGLGDAIASLNLQVGPQYKEETERKYVEGDVDPENPQPPQLEDVPTGKFIQVTPTNSLQPSAQLRSSKGAANARVLSDPNLAVTPEGKKEIWGNKLNQALAVQGLKNEGTVAAAIARGKASPNGAVKSTDVVNSEKWITDAESAVVQMFAGGESMDPATARAIAMAAYQDKFGSGMPTENASMVVGEFIRKNGLSSGVLHDPWGWGKHTMGAKKGDSNVMLTPNDISGLVSRAAAPAAATVATPTNAPATQAAAPAAAAPQANSPVASAIAPPDQDVALPTPEAPFGLRKDGTPKGPGFIQLQGKDGSVMTEISVGVDAGGIEKEIPTLVPTLSEAEKQYLIDGGDPRKSPSIMTKAIQHAQQRMKDGKNVFAEPGEQSQQPASPPPGIPAIDQRVDGHVYDIPGKGKYKWNASTQKWSRP